MMSEARIKSFNDEKLRCVIIDDKLQIWKSNDGAQPPYQGCASGCIWIEDPSLTG